MGDLPWPGQANTIAAWTMFLALVEELAVLNERDGAGKLWPLVLEAIAMYSEIGMPKHMGMAGARLSKL